MKPTSVRPIRDITMRLDIMRAKAANLDARINSRTKWGKKDVLELIHTFNGIDEYIEDGGTIPDQWQKRRGHGQTECAWCREWFPSRSNDIYPDGEFCSRACHGEWSSLVQAEGIDAWPLDLIL